jgi:5-methylcytosine-specific restriction endonuclease McrA
MDKQVSKRYDQLLMRSYKRDLNMFLFKCFVEGNTNLSFISDNYPFFMPDAKFIGTYTSIHQLSKESDIIEGTELKIGEFDKFLKQWKTDNYYELPKLKEKFLAKFISIDSFLKFYETTEKRCEYCKITEEDINLLLKHKKLYTKSLFNRGKSLEIDRKDSSKSYEESNIVFCCYWCNNAKTDEFSEDEFKQIGSQIKIVWENRLKKTF